MGGYLEYHKDKVVQPVTTHRTDGTKKKPSLILHGVPAIWLARLVTSVCIHRVLLTLQLQLEFPNQAALQ